MSRGQRIAWWWRYWIRLSRSRSFRSWWVSRRGGKRVVKRVIRRSTGIRVNLPQRATLYLRKIKNVRNRLALQYLLGFTYRTNRKVYIKIWNQVRRNQRVGYWVKYFFTKIRRGFKFRSWYKSIIVNGKAKGMRRVITRSTGSRSTGSRSRQVNLTAMMRYLRATNRGFFVRALRDLRKGMRARYWINFWKTIKKSGAYRRWAKSAASKRGGRRVRRTRMVRGRRVRIMRRRRGNRLQLAEE